MFLGVFAGEGLLLLSIELLAFARYIDETGSTFFTKVLVGVDICDLGDATAKLYRGVSLGSGIVDLGFTTVILVGCGFFASLSTLILS